MTNAGADRVPERRGDDRRVPASVRLGNVVPPEDPEDWTRPLTWVAAGGMLAAPLVALAWFIAAPPLDSTRALPLSYAVAIAVAVGATATGATQQGAARALLATLGSALFAALALVIVGVVTAGERQVGQASPTLAHAAAGAVAGIASGATAAIVAGVVARLRGRWLRLLPPLAAGCVIAYGVVGALLGG